MKYTADCPSCAGEFEVSGPVSVECGTQCSHCGHKFTPEKIHRIQSDKDFAPSAPARDPEAVKDWERYNASVRMNSWVRRLEEIATLAEIGSGLLAVVAVITVFMGAIAFLADGHWGEVPYWSAGLFSLALVIFFFAQLIHIRAALEKLHTKE